MGLFPGTGVGDTDPGAELVTGAVPDGLVPALMRHGDHPVNRYRGLFRCPCVPKRRRAAAGPGALRVPARSRSIRKVTGRAPLALIGGSMLCAACTDAGLDRSGGSSPRPATVVALAANNDGVSDRDYRNALAGAPAVARLLDNVAAVSRTSDGSGWRMTKRPAAQVDTVQDVVAGQTDLGWPPCAPSML
ncbi:MAG: hypothetical protein ACKVZ6_08830 [Kineosporiaceae bacterium]